MLIRSALVILLACAAAGARAQAPGVRIEANDHPEYSQAVLDRAEAMLLAGGQPLDANEARKLLAEPEPCEFDLPPVRRVPLAAGDVARLAREAQVRIGWYYHCKSCDYWHLSLTGGYAVSADGVVATCHHSIDPDGIEDMDEGYLVAVDGQDRVRPVVSILAADEGSDVALVRVEDLERNPLPLNVDVVPGDAAHVLSDPLGNSGYFSSGTVNRFYWRDPERPAPAAPRGGRPWPEGRQDLHTPEGIRRLQMNVSTDWAPGSSGCAVLDGCGNAIGHVSTISPLRESEPGDASDRFDGAVLITLHDATPARAVKILAEACRTAAGSKENLSPQR